MKTKLLVLILLVMVGCKSAKVAKTPEGGKTKGASSATAFDSYISGVKDPSLRKDLQAYKAGGIEKPIDTKGATPDGVIKTAKKFLGTPHKMGGTTKKGIDCSGLVMVSFASNGVTLPHGSHEQSRYGRLVLDRSQLQKGDLVYFARTYNSKNMVTHAGIYLGDGKFIHASASKGVMISNLEDPYYWLPKYLFGKRVF
ncbi:C40 family peptidase [Flammeovirgaceae bacterium SG7u.111]|nr:C40 family peptidase [Flammeovirgaceae bacterium SG7u.132]WPO37955.1 C40 family peptidase [Flammeovirgaceae bacterium SG7u.111]